MAEKTKLEKWLASLTPEQRAAFDASVEFGDQEYMGEVQRKLAPELRFGGEFGLPSAIGYGKGTNEDRAQISNYTTRGRGLPNVVGMYSKSMRGLGQSDEDFDPERRTALEKARTIAYMGTPPDKTARGAKGISVFLPVGAGEEERAYASKEGYISSKGERSTYPGTVAHELTHRGFDSPAFLDFLKQTGRNEGKPLSAGQEHRYIDKSPYEVNNRMVQDDYRNLLGEFKEWLTPERQEQYGVRLPVPAAEPVDPSMLDRLIDFIQGK
jgi:hypothetical protein